MVIFHTRCYLKNDGNLGKELCYCDSCNIEHYSPKRSKGSMLFPSGLFGVLERAVCHRFHSCWCLSGAHFALWGGHVFLTLVFSYLSSRGGTASIERMEERWGKWGVSHWLLRLLLSPCQRCFSTPARDRRKALYEQTEKSGHFILKNPLSEKALKILIAS